MRLGHLRRRRIYASFYRKPLSPGQRVLLFMMIVLLVLTATFSLTFIQFKPILLKLATAKASATVLTGINTIIEGEIISGTFDYSKMVTLAKDSEGNVTALETNMAAVNLLQSRITKMVLEKVQNLMVTDLRIPIGNALGGIVFSGRGPAFPVKILSVANVKTQFIHDFSAAGINQTRHKIMLAVSADLDVFVPGVKAETVAVTTEIEVCETVIVGRVPNIYAELGKTGGTP